MSCLVVGFLLEYFTAFGAVFLVITVLGTGCVLMLGHGFMTFVFNYGYVQIFSAVRTIISVIAVLGTVASLCS